MANLLLSFQVKDGRFSLCATVKGTTTRHYKVVNGLKSPNFDYWDKKEQRFMEPSFEAIYNNNLLCAMQRFYESEWKHGRFKDGKTMFKNTRFVYNDEFSCSFDALSAKKSETEQESPREKEPTLGQYVESLIQEMKYDSLKVPSRNYQCYITFLHKLQKEGNIIDTPISKVDDMSFIRFSDFVLKTLKGANYKGLMKRFHAVIVKAKKSKLSNVTLEFSYSDFAPKKKNDIERAINGVAILTEKEYDDFVNMDLDQIVWGGYDPARYNELYRDFCMFMYEEKLRPCDALRLKKSDIKDGIVVIANKKKMNYKDSSSVIQKTPLTEKARLIMEKYAGQSSKGYVFPFSMNEHDWNIFECSSFLTWNNRKARTLEQINTFLKKVKVVLGVNELTLYTFRHSTFTHEINNGSKSILQIAKEGGTSVAMLEKHYYNHIKK